MQSAEAITETITSMLCPKHDIYPSVFIIANEIEIVCCCTAFQEACTEKAKEILPGDSSFSFS